MKFWGEKAPELQRPNPEEILTITGSKTMDEARNTSLDPVLPDKRIVVILRNTDSLTLITGEFRRQPDLSATTSQ